MPSRKFQHLPYDILFGKAEMIRIPLSKEFMCGIINLASKSVNVIGEIVAPSLDA